MAALAGAQRGLSLCQALLRAQLGQRVNVMILEKALTLELRAVRGLRVLRQAHARAPRGFEPAAEPGDAHLRSGAERHLAAELCGAAGALLALDGADPAARGTAGVRRRGEVLRRRLPAVPLALARDAHADLPRDGAGARRPCQGSEAVRARRRACCSAIATSSRRLYREDRALSIRRDSWGFALGLVGHRHAVRRLCLDRTVDHRVAASRSAR